MEKYLNISKIDTPQAFIKIIYDSHHTALLTYARRLCKSNILFGEDLLQFFYIRLHTSYASLLLKYKEKGYTVFLKVIRNIYIDEHRKYSAKHIAVPLENQRVKTMVSLYSYCPWLYHSTHNEELGKVLPQMDYLIWRMHLQGYKQKEISKLMGLKTTTVGVRIHRLKGRLKVVYEERMVA